MVILATGTFSRRVMPIGAQTTLPGLFSFGSHLQRKKELGLFLVLILSGSMWFYLHSVGPREKKYHPSPDEIVDTHGDLLAPWYGTRELFVEHHDPYSPEVTRKIQSEYYGKPLTGAAHEPKDQQRFAYPVYVAFLFAPFVHLPFDTVRTIFWWFLPAITLVTIPAWLRLAGVQLSIFLLIALAALTFTTIPVFRGLNLQQLSLLVTGLLAACAVSLVNRRYVIAGILLALATMKPQMAIIPSAWLMLWVISNWRERKQLFWSFLITLGALFLASEYVLPGWFLKFLKGAVAYRQYAAGENLSELYLPGISSLILAGMTFALVVIVCWRTRRQPSESLGFAFTFCTVLVVSLFVVPASSAVFNQVLLFPALLLPLRTWDRMWNRDSRSRTSLLLLIAATFLPWTCAVITIFVWAFLPISALHRIWGLPLYGWQAVPFAALGFLVFMMKDVFEELPTNPTHDPKTV